METPMRLELALRVGLVISAVPLFGQPQRPCFAFLVKGDVRLTCEGKTTRITHRGDVEAFAASNEQASLTYTTSRQLRRSPTAASVLPITTLVNLRTNQMRVLEGVGGVVSTCGGLFPLNAGKVQLPGHDLVTGREVGPSPYGRFRCSSDEKTVVGSEKDHKGDLYLGNPPRTEIARATDFSDRGFEISPDGGKVAYRDNRGRLCLFSSPGPSQCIEKQGTLADSPSVNNLGEVLVAIGTGQECFYDGSYNFTPDRFPGASDESRDECLGIGYWRSDLKSVRIVEPLGRNPQWISSATARLLSDWSAHLAEPPKK